MITCLSFLLVFAWRGEVISIFFLFGLTDKIGLRMGALSFTSFLVAVYKHGVARLHSLLHSYMISNKYRVDDNILLPLF